MRLRDAIESDIEDILEMYRGIQGDTSLVESLEHCLTGNMGTDRMILAVADEKPVGFLWSRLTTDPETGEGVDEVKLMAIARDMYGRGIGGALLEEERKFAAEMGAKLLQIT